MINASVAAGAGAVQWLAKEQQPPSSGDVPRNAEEAALAVVGRRSGHAFPRLSTDEIGLLP